MRNSGHQLQDSSRPPVLLNVDGVINDLEMLIHLRMLEPEQRAAEMDRLEIDELILYGHRLAMPRYMPALWRAVIVSDSESRKSLDESPNTSPKDSEWQDSRRP